MGKCKINWTIVAACITSLALSKLINEYQERKMWKDNLEYIRRTYKDPNLYKGGNND